MPNFAVKPCTFEDGAAIAINNMAAFWQDEAWVLIWTRVEKTLEHVTSQAVLRSPQNLLNNREQKRHQKVVDVETVNNQSSCFTQESLNKTLCCRRSSDSGCYILMIRIGQVSRILPLAPPG